MFIETLKTLRLYERQSKLGVYHTFKRKNTLYVFRCDCCGITFSVPRAKCINIELPMIINMCVVFVILKDLHKKWVLKCVGSIKLTPAAIDLLVLTILPN